MQLQLKSQQAFFCVCRNYQGDAKMYKEMQSIWNIQNNF